MNRLHLVLAGILVVMLVGCRSSNKASSDDMKSDEQKEMKKPADPGPGVPPSHCRLVGTVVSIDTTLSSMTEDPCSKVPCVASVRIDEVVGYGSGFVGMLGKGSEIKMRFRYTLGPTSDVFPGMSPSLPGLETGSKFQADVRMSNSMLESGQAMYVVERYAVHP